MREYTQSRASGRKFSVTAASISVRMRSEWQIRALMRNEEMRAILRPILLRSSCERKLALLKFALYSLRRKIS